MNIENQILQELKAINGRIDNLEGRFDNLEGRFDNLEGRFDNLEGRFEKVEEIVEEQGDAIRSLGIRMEHTVDNAIKVLNEYADLTRTVISPVRENYDRIQMKQLEHEVRIMKLENAMEA